MKGDILTGGDIQRTLDPTDASKASISIVYDRERNTSTYHQKTSSPFQINFLLGNLATFFVD